MLLIFSDRETEILKGGGILPKVLQYETNLGFEPTSEPIAMYLDSSLLLHYFLKDVGDGETGGWTSWCRAHPD